MARNGVFEISCGVLVTDGERLLLGHATGSPRWDIPKGRLEPGEDFEAAARRELDEETGLAAGPLAPLGRFAYLAGKDLVLFVWRPVPLPDPSGLVCRMTFTSRHGAVLPELDRFGLYAWDEALRMVGRGMATVLEAVRNRV